VLRDGANQLAYRGLALEPSVDLSFGHVRSLRHASLVVEGLKVIDTVTDELWHRHFGRALLHVGVFATIVGLGEVDHPTLALL
jgi:hypothetical protein